VPRDGTQPAAPDHHSFSSSPHTHVDSYISTRVVHGLGRPTGRVGLGWVEIFSGLGWVGSWVGKISRVVLHGLGRPTGRVGSGWVEIFSGLGWVGLWV